MPCGGDERELLQRACEGDGAAFDALREKLEPQVQRFVRRLIWQSESEEEIVQDAFLALYMNLERMEPVERLRPFLFRVVRNLCYDELRRRGRFDIVSLDADPDSNSALAFATDPRPLPDEAVHWSLLYSEVQKAMERLPEAQRQALILYGEEDMLYEEIAEVMATDIGTVKSRLHHARKNLLRLLRPETIEALGVGEMHRNERHKYANTNSSREEQSDDNGQ